MLTEIGSLIVYRTEDGIRILADIEPYTNLEGNGETLTESLYDLIEKVEEVE
jgi:hypothetical protein